MLYFKSTYNYSSEHAVYVPRDTGIQFLKTKSKRLHIIIIIIIIIITQTQTLSSLTILFLTYPFPHVLSLNHDSSHVPTHLSLWLQFFSLSSWLMSVLLQYTFYPTTVFLYAFSEISYFCDVEKPSTFGPRTERFETLGTDLFENHTTGTIPGKVWRMGSLNTIFDWIFRVFLTVTVCTTFTSTLSSVLGESLFSERVGSWRSHPCPV
jgi:hypothetical protein